MQFKCHCNATFVLTKSPCKSRDDTNCEECQVRPSLNKTFKARTSNCLLYSPETQRPNSTLEDHTRTGQQHTREQEPFLKSTFKNYRTPQNEAHRGQGEPESFWFTGYSSPQPTAQIPAAFSEGRNCLQQKSG